MRRRGLLGLQAEQVQVCASGVPFAHLMPDLVLVRLRDHWAIEKRASWVRPACEAATSTSSGGWDIAACRGLGRHP
jgi:hypothetical protein